MRQFEIIYRVTAYKKCQCSKAGQHRCPVCQKFLDQSPRYFRQTPCWKKLVHPSCSIVDLLCLGCDKSLVILPCAYCKDVIPPQSDDVLENFQLAARNRTPSCEADCHEQCWIAACSGNLSMFGINRNWHTCPICVCPLLANKMDEVYMSAKDARSRMKDIQQRNELSYYDWPCYIPYVHVLVGGCMLNLSVCVSHMTACSVHTLVKCTLLRVTYHDEEKERWRSRHFHFCK